MARRGQASARWSWVRPVLGATILVALVWRLGADAFLVPLRRLDVLPLLAAVAVSALTTVSAAWRWRLVCRGLGSDLPLGTAVAAYYRSQFLNLVLPGGVLGDVHRAVHHGRDVGDLGRAGRAVVGERCAGQLVQLALTVGILLVLPSPVRSAMPAVVLGLLLAAGVVILVWTLCRRSGSPVRWVRLMRRVAGRWPSRVWWQRSGPWVVVASAVAVLGHVAIFVIAARAAGSSVSLAGLLPLAFLVLLAMSIPANVAGWGPREGAAAWAFAAAGLGASAGVAAAVVYGVLALAGVLPGGVVLAISSLRRGARGARGARVAPLRRAFAGR